MLGDSAVGKSSLLNAIQGKQAKVTSTRGLDFVTISIKSEND